ncbi:hypothetical protein [uncultured Variovorax sp.]|jgi:hypothetical protein|uniref:hypothetical protein n=1 Tax=uncultured Variovorax sp. TaxID=114708 RepID=UPI00263A104E|nr:hypothetical protein [uncultured Variovorax sp.]
MTTKITLRQAEALLAFFGGQDAEVTIAAESPGLSPGLYAWLTDYPDEGAQYLGPTEVDEDLADKERLPAPAVQPGSITQAWVLLQALVEAVRVFRNEAALARLGGLRGTRGYIGLCQAWDDARDWLEATSAPERPIGEVVVSTSLTGEDGLQVIKWAADAPPISVGMKVYAAASVGATEPTLTNAERDELQRLRALINTPHTKDWMAATELEAAHQVERWSAAHDAGKQPEDWFWLLGYLSGKALAALRSGDHEKGLHHIVSSSAALLNWHRNVTGKSTSMRPGIEAPKGGL